MEIFKILGIKENETTEVIYSAYKNLCKKDKMKIILLLEDFIKN